MRELHGRTALVTGATGGLGGGIARALAAEGMRLVLTGRDQERLDALAGELGGSAVRADLTDTADLDRVADAAGDVDVLVNNAGVIFYAAFPELERAELERAVALNVTAPLLLTHRLLPGMLARRRGHVVMVGSLAGYAYPAFQSVYATTKAAVVALGRSLRAELRDTGVGVSVVSPIYVEEEGVYADNVAPHGLRSPWLVGTVDVERVGRSVVKAIRGDRPELIVASRPMRPVFALGSLSPRLGDAILRWVGIDELQRRAAEIHGEEEPHT
jgi:short-subunit dehydrogenase